MKLSIHPSADAANVAATDCLAGWLTAPASRNVMVAAGNTPIELYRRIGERGLRLSHLNVFALDEYVGVPLDEPRNCANLMRRCVQQAWGIPSAQFHTVSSLEANALASMMEHERRIAKAGGLDIVILGLGQNGHLGFNEPGSAEDSSGRLLDLETISIEANRKWFGGDYAPGKGVTVGLKTILAARRVLIMAYGSHKTAALKAMVEGPRGPQCPASLLQGHANVNLFMDEAAAAALNNRVHSAEMLTEANEGNEERQDNASSLPLLASVQSSTRHVIGIDVGGTKIATGLIAFPEGRVLAERLTPTLACRGGRSVLDDVLRLVRELASATERVHAIGLGVCELVDRDGKVVSSNCIHWQDQPVREELSAIAPAVLEADVRAAALAESLFGAARGFSSFLYVTVGTGISCCLMLDGKPFLGARGATGTMGSSPLSIPCEQCSHVSQRTLEEIAAGPALVTRFNALHGQATTGRDVLAAASAGNSVAAQIVRSASEALESQVALLVNVLDPEAVVIGGGLGLSDGPYWDHFIASARHHIWSELHRDLPILRAATGADAGWIGAAAKAWQEFSNGSNQSQTLKSKT